MKRSIHAERVAHRNTLRLLCPDGHAPLTLSLAMTQLILHTHLVYKLGKKKGISPKYIALKYKCFAKVNFRENLYILVNQLIL